MKELLDHEILKVQNGSKLYGTDTPQSDDDYLAIFVEPPSYIFSTNMAKTIPLHDRGPNEKNVDAEVDGIAYPLRHFIKLAQDGNPSILTIFFAQPEHIVSSTYLGQLLIARRELFCSLKAGPKFLGYMNSQLQRLKGEKKGHIPSRPEIVEKYGFDTKYAMQVLRLAIQGHEFLLTGQISLPVSDANKILLSDVRNGKYDYEETLEILDIWDVALKRLVDNPIPGILPEEPDYDGIWKLNRYIHEEYWAKLT